MRYNLNNKISVLNKMIGLGEEVVPEPFYAVPQNSATNFTQTIGLCELKPFENSAINLKKIQNCKCPHCERMAKNFLYLESLIRSNYNPSNNCNVCHSSLQYLQNVNKCIMKEFGNIDSVVEVAKAFGHNNIKCKTIPKRLANSSHLSSKNEAVGHIRKKAAVANSSKSGKKIAGNQSLKKNASASAKKGSRKLKFKKDSSNHSAVKDVSVQNTSKVVKVKKIKGLKSKTKSFLRQVKTKK